MRWRGPDYSEAMEWHTWFCWHPVTVGGKRVWLERIQRRQRWSGDDSWPIFLLSKILCLIEYEYRELNG